MRRLVLLGSSLLAAVLLAFFTVLAPLVDRGENRVAQASLPAVTSNAKALHARLTVVDLHADPLLMPRDLLVRVDHGHVDVPRLIEGNVALQVFGAVTQVPPGINYIKNDGTRDQLTWLVASSRWPLRTWNDRLQRALYLADKLTHASERSGGKLRIIRSAAELDQYLTARQTGRPMTAGLLAMEGLQALGDNLARIDTLFAAGYRMMAPTHFFDNAVAGSSAGVTKGGLTPFGRQIIRRLVERHIVIDLAHASEKTVDDVLDMVSLPVVVSHTGVQGTCPGPRNLTDHEIRRIGEAGGVIGIGYWDAAICEVTPQSVAKAIGYTAALVGIDHVALGSDFDGGTTTTFDTAELDRITGALLAAGFTADEVAKIMGGNALRVLRTTLPPN